MSLQFHLSSVVCNARALWLNGGAIPLFSNFSAVLYSSRTWIVFTENIWSDSRWLCISDGQITNQITSL